MRRRATGVPLAKPHKYGAVPTVVDNIRFASKKEARRYGELKLLEKAGEIEDLTLQPRFPLLVPSTSGQLLRAAQAMTQGGTFRIGEMRADFAYLDYKRGRVIEDVKGYDNALSRWKRRHVETQYGVKIVLI